MTMYTTTVVPSFDLLGGVEMIQRLLHSHTEIAQVAWDNQTQATVAVLKTIGEHNCLKDVAASLKQFELPLIESKDLVDAIHKAKELAHTEDVVEFIKYKEEDSFSL